MEGVTDFPFRRWITRCSMPSFLSTPFLRITDDFPRTTLPIAFVPELLDDDYKRETPPTLLQLMGPSPKRIADVGAIILEKGYSFDVNFGCPAPTVIGRGSGSALLRNVEGFQRFYTQLNNLLPEKSFSIKIRTGFDSSELFPNLIDVINDTPPKKVTIHGRTRTQKYTGKADWNLIESAAKKLNCPVVGSGDIFCKSSLDERLRVAPSVAGVIISRGALHNPWIFDKFTSPNPTPDFHEKLKFALITYGFFIDSFYLKDYDFFKKIDLKISEKIPAHVFSSEQWQDALLLICKDFYKSNDYKQVELDRKSLSRMKMIWTYLYPSLPSTYHRREILRAKNLKDFIEQFDKALV